MRSREILECISRHYSGRVCECVRVCLPECVSAYVSLLVCVFVGSAQCTAHPHRELHLGALRIAAGRVDAAAAAACYY